MRLQVSLDQGLEAIVPSRFPEHKVFEFIQEKQSWILNKLKHYAKYADIRKSEDELFYLGEIYKIKILNGSKNSVFFNGEEFEVQLNKESKSHLRQVLENWYRKEARNNLTYLVHELSQEYGLKINRITIREQKTRWGSASKNGNLNFNFRLMMAPEEVIKYVVIHELCHLTEMNHSKKFWRLVRERCPDYPQHVRWLKRHGPLLKI